MQWFRFYNEVLNDPKVQCLPGETFKAWINILCLASKNDGKIPSDQDTAFALRLPFHDVTSHLEIILSAGLIDDKNGVRYPHNWNKRQFKSDTSTDRVKRYRKRYRNGDETLHETPSSVSVSVSVSDSVRKGGAGGKPKITLEELSVDHNTDWLTQKRISGKYLMHDEHFILEYFKNYCRSKGKKYDNYLAAYRNAFEWESCQPGRNSKTHGTSGARDDRSEARKAIDAGEEIIARRNARRAAEGRPTGTGPVDETSIADLRAAQKVW